MTEALSRLGPLRFNGLTVEELDDGLAISDEGAGVVHQLDPVSSIVFTLCDGQTTGGQIVDVVASAMGISDDRAAVLLYSALDQLVERRLVDDDPALERKRYGSPGRSFRIRHDTLDDAILRDVYVGAEYDLPQHVPPHTTVIDIGAHIGGFTARMVDAGAYRVIALEPQAANFRLASINLATDINSGIVDLRQLAVWPAPSGQELEIDSAPAHPLPGGGSAVNTGGHRVRPGEHDAPANRGHTITTVSLDDLIDSIEDPEGQVWVKLDCEGAEWPILESTQSLDSIDVLAAELHLSSDADDDRVTALISVLQWAGFIVIQTLDNDSPALRRLSAWRTSKLQGQQRSSVRQRVDDWQRSPTGRRIRSAVDKATSIPFRR